VVPPFYGGWFYGDENMRIEFLAEQACLLGGAPPYDWRAACAVASNPFTYKHLLLEIAIQELEDSLHVVF